MERWSIYIDVEGFGVIYKRDKGRALAALGGLMDALFRVGSTAFSVSPDRLFIHQFGDGFLVVSDFPEPKPERPLALAIAIMRHLLVTGVATKAAVSAGDFSDVFDCYPPDVQAAAVDHRHVRIGEGLMTIIPVMGSALISPYKLAAKRSGAVLLLDTVPFSSVPAGVKLTSTAPVVVDWIHSDFPLVNKICEEANLAKVDATSAARHLRQYINGNRDLSKNWVSSTLDSVGLATAIF